MATLEGTIVEIHRNEEKIPNDFFKTMSYLILFIILSPLILALSIASFLIYFALDTLRLGILAQLFNPAKWFSGSLRIIEIIATGKHSRSGCLTVFRGKVKTNSNENRQFIMYGELVRGNLAEKRNVKLEGYWDKKAFSKETGTFYAKKGHDNTTDSSIASSYRNYWKFIFFILLIAAGYISWRIYEVV